MGARMVSFLVNFHIQIIKTSYFTLWSISNLQHSLETPSGDGEGREPLISLPTRPLSTRWSLRGSFPKNNGG